jgi:hypothetical protein
VTGSADHLPEKAEPRTYLAAVEVFIKRRGVPAPGSIPDVLQMFRSEVLFYREIAPVVGIRVPECYQAEETSEGTLLVLEDLSSWTLGADSVKAAAVLSDLHHRWQGRAQTAWPWLRQPEAGADLVAHLYDSVWPVLAERGDLAPRVRDLGEHLVGRVMTAEAAVAAAGPITLIHGDASNQNLRTSPTGEIALLDWEDVSAEPGILDLAWLLLSSTEPARWEETIAAYGTANGLTEVLPSVVVQGLLTLSDLPQGSDEATGWNDRLQEAVDRLS